MPEPTVSVQCAPGKRFSQLIPQDAPTVCEARELRSRVECGPCPLLKKRVVVPETMYGVTVAQCSAMLAKKEDDKLMALILVSRPPMRLRSSACACSSTGVRCAGYRLRVCVYLRTRAVLICGYAATRRNTRSIANGMTLLW
eukprot:671209-Rhodomonas_salina.1